MIKRLEAVACSMFLVGLATAASAETVLPRPDDRGDFSRRSNHTYWQVIDPDPKGLNCRMGNLPIERVWEPRNRDSFAIGRWRVVGKLKQHQSFEAELTPGGFVVTFDRHNKPWIFVATGKPSNCFVRAHSQYVRPVQKPQGFF